MGHQNIIKNKKGQMELSIVLFVLIVLVLLIISLVVFNLRAKEIKNKVSAPVALDDVYNDADLFEFYLYNLAKETIKANPNADATQFLFNFKMNYLKYSSQSGFPAEYWADSYKNQIKNNQYEITVQNKKLNFALKDFAFRKDLIPGEASHLSVISYNRTIAFQINI